MKGSIRPRSKGSWRLRYDASPDASGKRKQISETVRGTKTDAERILRERLTSLENGTYVPRMKETLSAYLRRWLGSYAATNTTIRTQQGYRGNIERYILPSLGHVALQDLRPRQVQTLYASLLVRGLYSTFTAYLGRL